MTAINFGVGTIIGRRTDISNPTPAFLGIMQDIQIDFDQTLKDLMGQYKMAVDVAPAALKVTGKAKFAKIQANATNDLMLGQTITAAAGQSMAIAETHSIPSVSTYTVTVTNAVKFQQDLGVFYSNTGVQFTRVAAGSEAIGAYSVNEATGVYTFAVADQGVAVLIYYDYSMTTLKQISMSNQLMGVGPTFSINIQESYTNNAGTTNSIFLKLNACRSSKLSWPFKNADYTIQELDFQAFADQANNWGSISFSE